MKITGMKMAKASEQDIDAAGDLMALLDTISRDYYPAKPGDDDAPTWFDEDDRDHLRAFYDQVKALLDRAPGFPGRVIGGMCYVIMYDKNEIIDPDADTIELHPRLTKALEAAERVTELEAEVERLKGLINSPEIHDFAKGVTVEVAHQRERWGTSHDAGKTVWDWFWLVGYLAQKAADAHQRGDNEKALHHAITTAAACGNWHAAMQGLTNMRPGIDTTAIDAAMDAGQKTGVPA